MEVTVNKSKIVLVQGDITTQATQAIVNAANTRLAGGGGVDGAIHSAGGPTIMAECRKIGGCPTGDAVITTGGTLKAKYVIHAVGPIYRGGTQGEEKLLASAYRKSLELAAVKGIHSISFPSISTGAYNYPIRQAARIALATAVDYLTEHSQIELVRFVLFGAVDLEVYEAALKDLTK
ncbi:MAG: O-acetyl-ADP-ribose deacetylase [Deltaproteobacteria bacterium]|nr:O-acetyl-ADP-ribose deacetylase [Candidatus Zymogenaceae bacterium]